jgi:hypothetical protein
VVTVASSEDGVTFSPEVTVANGDQPAVPEGRYLSVSAALTRSTHTDADEDGILDGPILFDLTLVAASNLDPDCTEPFASIERIWPANHGFVDVEIFGVTDPDGDPVIVTIDSIFQDEPVDGRGDGSFVPDGQGVGESIAQVRAERSGRGDGRVYHIGFTAIDTFGGMCSGKVLVGVPRSQGDAEIVDGGALYDSTLH